MRQVMADLPEDSQGGGALPVGGRSLTGPGEQVLPVRPERGLQERPEPQVIPTGFVGGAPVPLDRSLGSRRSHGMAAPEDEPIND